MKVILVMDAGWVVGSLVLLGLAPGWLSGTGTVLVAAVAALVAVLAGLQAVGLRRAGAGVGTTA